VLGALAGVALLAASVSVDALDKRLQPGSCDGLQQLTPDELVACLQAGPVDLLGATITGPLDLTAVDVVPSPFRCVDCTFSGDVNVSDVTFDRLVALERVVIDGDLDAVGARFAGAVLARGQREDQPSGVRGDADFSLATFEGALQLDSTTFGGEVSFDSARFEGAVSMSGTDIRGRANFDRIVAAESFAIGGEDPFDPTGANGVAEGEVTLRPPLPVISTSPRAASATVWWRQEHGSPAASRCAARPCVATSTSSG
jgi:hypothetical protein